MKKIFITSAMSVLFLAASVFAFNQTSATTNENFCPLKQAAAQNSEMNFENTKVVFAKSNEDCCQKGADCCKGGACCKSKRN